MSVVAFEVNVGLDFSLPCITDLSAAATQFKFLVLGSDGNLAVNAVAGGPCIGVLQDGPVGTSGSPRGAAFRYGGITKIQCGGTFAPGDLLSSDGSGKAVKYTGATVFTGTPYTVSGSQVLGVALSNGSSGDVSSMIFNPSGLAAAGAAA